MARELSAADPIRPAVIAPPVAGAARSFPA